MGCGPSRSGDSSEALLVAKEALLSEPPQTDFLRNLRLVATVLAVSLGSSLQFGFATGSLNNLEQIIPDALATYGNPIDIAQWALINSSFSVGGLLGSSGSFIPLARCGRRKTLLMANIFVFLSSFLMYYGTVWWVLLLGRVSIGVVAGVAQMAAGSYMTEIAPIGIRGSVGVCSQVGIVIGITLANFLTAPSFHALGSARHWRFVFLVPSAFALFQLVVLPFCPQSPSFLIQKYGAGRTLSTLVLLHKPSSAIEVLTELQAQVNTAGSGSAYTIPQLIGDVKLRKQLLVGVVIKVGVQFSGIDAIFYYSTLMFRHAHVANPQMATTLLSLVNLLMTFLAMLIMESAGRRRLMMTTWVGMCAGFSAIFISSYISEDLGVAQGAMANLEVCAMVLIIVAFAVGVGNVEGFLISEIMPVYAKDTLAAIGQPLNWIANLIVATLFPILFQTLGRYAYLIFVCLTAFFGGFTYFKVPETKGKTIAQVTSDFDNY